MGGRSIGAWPIRGLLLATSMAVLAAPATAASGLHVIPFPGTPDASPLSQVIFSSLTPTELRSLTVTGSRSGSHAGRLVDLPDGAGTAFVPDRPFTSGEHVSVTAALSSAAAGTAAGARGATRLRFSFGVEEPAAAPAAPVSPTTASTLATSARPTTASMRPPDRHGRLRFRSQPDFYPPQITATSDSDTESGDFFLTPHNGGQSGPLILNSSGQLVWFRPLEGKGAFNLELQRYRGQPVLTWWQGDVNHGQGNGADVILNGSYHTVAVLHAGNGYVSDLHEFQLTRQGTALIDAYVAVPHSLTSVGGPANGKVWDCVIQELDVRTGRVLWEWHALGHVPIKDSHERVHPGRPYDYFHLNAIEQLPDGNLLVSARNMWAVYKINRVNGQVMWKLGGKHSNFHLGPRANFEWQHDAHISGDTLTLFDDASDAFTQAESESSAKVLKVNIAARTAVLEHRYTHRPPLIAGAMGSVQIVPNGDVVVGWGTADDFSEYTSSGALVFNGIFPLGTNSYRAYRFPWHGQPVGRPALALLPFHNGDLAVYASWNGATQIADWRVLGGPSQRSLLPLDTRPKTNFETVITLGSEPRYVAVQALSASGQVLGTSNPRADPAVAS